MKKLLTLCAAICAAATIFAAERVVWEGNKAISWNSDVYAGEQFETPDGTFADLLKDDTIKVSVEAKIDAPQYVMTYKAGDSWEWTDLEGVNVADGIMTYVVASDEIAGFIAQRGLIFRGQGYDMTKIAVVTPDSEPIDPITPEEPSEPYVYAIVWTGDVAISWNQEVYAGADLDTYAVQQDMFAGLAEGDSIHVHFAEAIEGAQFVLQYKTGDNWDWTDLAPIAQGEDFFGYKVATEEIAQDIADRGVIVRGQGYHAIRIEIGKPENVESAVNVLTSTSTARKIIEAGQVFIIKEGVRYTILGIVVR